MSRVVGGRRHDIFAFYYYALPRASAAAATRSLYFCMPQREHPFADASKDLRTQGVVAGVTNSSKKVRGVLRRVMENHAANAAMRAVARVGRQAGAKGDARRAGAAATCYALFADAATMILALCHTQLIWLPAVSMLPYSAEGHSRQTRLKYARSCCFRAQVLSDAFALCLRDGGRRAIYAQSARRCVEARREGGARNKRRFSLRRHGPSWRVCGG